MQGVGRDRQQGRDLTLSSGRGYESGALKVKNEIPDKVSRFSPPGIGASLHRDSK